MTKERDDKHMRRHYEKQCRHFTGIHHETCLSGIQYSSVRDHQPGYGMARWPCLTIGKDKAATICEKFSAWTPEEAAQMVVEDKAAVERMLKNLKDGVCNICGATIAEETQVGSCVYAKPCGHRIGQGKAKKKVCE